MKKIYIVLGCIILAGGLFALDYWQEYNQDLVSEQLKQDNAQIRQLMSEKSELEAQLEETEETEENEEDSSDTPKAVLCFHSLNQSFYTEVYPSVKEKVDSGVLVLESEKLPGDSNYISVQDFTNLIDSGWVCAVSVDKAADETQWRTGIETYLNALSSRVSVKPTAYYLSSGSCSESDAQMLGELGFDTVLCHEQTAAKTIGELNVIQLYGYNDPAMVQSVTASEGYCGLEIWVSWNRSVLTRVRYTAAALDSVLNDDAVSVVGMHELTEENADDGDSATPAERIAQIDQEIDKLYHEG